MEKVAGAEGPKREFVAKLGSDTFEERENAVHELYRLRAGALKLLLVARQSEDAEVARLAQKCVQEIENDLKVASLFPQLRSPKRVRREDAYSELGHLKLDRFVPTLVSLLDDPSKKTQEAAVGLLTRVGPGTEPALPKLLRILPDKKATEHARFMTMYLLEKLLPPGKADDTRPRCRNASGDLRDR